MPQVSAGRVRGVIIVRSWRGSCTGIGPGGAWRDLPERFGPWQTAWKRHARFSRDGTWDKILTALQVRADANGGIDWRVSVDSTINRAHQHAATLPRTTGGTGESQESETVRTG